MDCYYEESMPWSSNSIYQDYSKYYINDTISHFDKINFLLKKGETFQRLYWFNNFAYYTHNTSPDVIYSLISYILENIDLWDKTLQQVFPSALTTWLLNPNNSTYPPDWISLILRNIISGIVNYDDSISIIYIKNFQRIIDSHHSICNINLAITKPIVEYVNNLGKFGNSNNNKRFSVFWCCEILRIRYIDEDLRRILYKRYWILCSELEQCIKTQIVYEMRFMLLRYNDVNNDKEFIHWVLKFLNENDELVQSECIISVIKNFGNIPMIVLNEVVVKIKDILNNDQDEYDKLYFNNIFTSWFEVFSGENREKIKDIIIRFYEEDIIGVLLRKIFKSNNKQSIAQWMHWLNNIGDLNNYLGSRSNINMDEIFDFVMAFINNVYHSEEDYEYVKNWLYSHWHVWIKFITNDKVFELISMHINASRKTVQSFLIFSKENIVNMYKKNVCKIWKVLCDNPNVMGLFQVIISNTQSTTLLSITDQKVLLKISKAFKIIIPKVYQHNRHKKEEMYTKIFTFLKQFLSGSLGYHIKIAFIQVIPHLNKYSTNKANYINYMNTTFLQSKSFFIRRLFFSYMVAMFETWSCKYILSHNWWESYLRCMNDKLNWISLLYISYTKSIRIQLYLNGLSISAMKVIKSKKQLNILRNNDEEISGVWDDAMKELSVVDCDNVELHSEIGEEERKKYISECEIHEEKTRNWNWNWNPEQQSHDTNMTYTVPKTMKSTFKGIKFLTPVGGTSNNSITGNNTTSNCAFNTSNSSGSSTIFPKRKISYTSNTLTKASSKIGFPIKTKEDYCDRKEEVSNMISNNNNNNNNTINNIGNGGGNITYSNFFSLKALGYKAATKVIPKGIRNKSCVSSPMNSTRINTKGTMKFNTSNYNNFNVGLKARVVNRKYSINAENPGSVLEQNN